MNFTPNYQNIMDVAYNKKAKRLPLYEHNVSPKVIEKIINKRFADLINGEDRDKEEFFNCFGSFFSNYGYDYIPYECCVGQVMPGSGALGSSLIDPVIKNYEDFLQYPWEEVPNLFFEKYAGHFKALAKTMPKGMKAVGGVGNGVFECVQDVVGYQNLCLIMYDDPQLFAELFSKAGEMLNEIWQRFLKQEYVDSFCLLRFGDDLGFATSTMLGEDEIRQHILPQYKKIVSKVHNAGKPFLLHSCGKIFNLMEDLICDVKIDAKHSNEDGIAPFTHWVEMYGDRIGNFGGVDLDVLIRTDKQELKEYIYKILEHCKKVVAFGTGNSIPDYVAPEQYLNMIEIVREWRNA